MSVIPPSISSSTIPGQNPTTQLNNFKSQYPNYNFPNMFKEQVGKSSGYLQRLTLIIPGVNGSTPYAFIAHIDPNHLTHEQNKRVVQQDVITGVVLQDFGYTVENIELKGTTGAAYYTEIQALDLIFNNQSVNGLPLQVTMTIESRTYTGVWKSFSYQRMIVPQGGNIYEYTMSFTVLQRMDTTGSNDTALTGSSVVSQNASANAANGTSTLTFSYIQQPGSTPRQYAESSGVSLTKIKPALGFMAEAWDTSKNNGQPYPGDDTPLGINDILTVPSSWSDYFGNS